MAPPQTRARSRSRSRSRSRRRAPSRVVTRTPMDKAKCVVALVNLKSGGHRCAVCVHERLQRELGVQKVHILFAGAPTQHMSDVEDFFTTHVPDIVIVAGGDGTISFVMDVVKSMQEQGKLPAHKAVIAPFPLGTGNDLCGSLGFGSGFARWMVMGGIRFRKMFRRYRHAEAIPVNRWRLSFGPLEDADGARTRMPAASTAARVKRVMNNYLSIGFDAAIAERLNAFRRRHPRLFITRPVIKLWYAAFATVALFTERRLADGVVTVTIDGVTKTLPQGTKALIVSNMLTYAGGSPLWRDEPRKDTAAPSVSDRIVEVTTLNGVWHLAFIRLGLTFATKVGQGKHVQVHIRAPCRMQYDGEPIDGLFDETSSSTQQYTLDISYYVDSDVLEARQGAVRPSFFAIYWPLILTAVGVALAMALVVRSYFPFLFSGSAL